MFDMTHVINKQSCVIIIHYLGQMFDVKDYPIYHQELFDIFENDRCLGLSGKPKLFFFQACRGGTIYKFEPTMYQTYLKGLTEYRKPFPDKTYHIVLCPLL